MIAIRQILVPTDFGEPSRLALEYGRHLARQFDSRLHVLHTVENVMIPGGAEIPMAAIQQVEQGLEHVGRQQMDQLITDDDRATLAIVPVIRTASSAAVDILEYAREHAIDLIIMGTHGRSALPRLLMGSVAERIVRSAPCPVLTVRRDERDFIQPDALAPVTPS